MSLHALFRGSGVRLSFGIGVGVGNGAGPVIDLFSYDSLVFLDL